MKLNNIIQQKTFDFSIRIINASLHIKKKNNEFDLSRQLLRSGTSIGANVEESIGAYTTADFVHKLAIAYKEARETRYWIRLLYATRFLSKDEASSLLKDVIEICKILAKIQLTVKQKLTADKKEKKSKLIPKV